MKLKPHLAEPSQQSRSKSTYWTTRCRPAGTARDPGKYKSIYELLVRFVQSSGNIINTVELSRVLLSCWTNYTHMLKRYTRLTKMKLIKT